MLEVTAPVVPNATPVLQNPELVAARSNAYGEEIRALVARNRALVFQNAIIGIPKYESCAGEI